MMVLYQMYSVWIIEVREAHPPVSCDSLSGESVVSQLLYRYLTVQTSVVLPRSHWL